ncbi:glycyl radical protein [Anoxynatronum buryatiense]|uniref:Formate C-acetyltransferase n=1 Tax=Anoxynatronum buryatiense TaxID=489973 RepID=A0AA45WZ91_9CLOT|nr:formate C-acetyltransferase/glycerol dehydratase family glycyl radical enzyme [Anoxynatronum buryatiense]SMP72178.1 formate C-acetyltransferase [Anoxynatronum buryatiense]
MKPVATDVLITDRVESARQSYIHSKPTICTERARIWTASHRQTEGEPIPIRRAKAFKAACEQLPVSIFEGELLVGTPGSYRRTGVLTPEFSWRWVDQEMDHFDKRPQDPYYISQEQREFLRKEVFPYWNEKSLEEVFLKQLPPETSKILVDTGIIDNDSKWRQAVGEVTPDYQDVLFVKGYQCIFKEATEAFEQLEMNSLVNIEKREFYQSVMLAAEGIMTLAERYADEATRMAAALDKTDDEAAIHRREELMEIARVCRKVPAKPPETFREALQFVWFVQLSGILSENPLALNLGRFDQYMAPYYEADLAAGRLTEAQALELVESLWIKLSEWVWTISANTANYFAGYNQFQNLTVGGRKRDGSDATNPLSYLCLKATETVKTHQPGLSVRVHADCPEAFLMAVTRLVATGTGFPAIHNDTAGYQMMLNAGYAAEDARDWSNCGCVVPHFRKTGEWTAAVNVNFGAALEYALNSGRSRLTGEQMGISEQPLERFDNFEAIKSAFFKQLAYLIKHSVIGTVLAQKLHMDLVPRPFLSTCVDGCLQSGKDLSRGGAVYNVGPVLTGIGLGVVANGLMAVKKLVFDEKTATLKNIHEALDADWAGFETLRELALAVPKYGNDQEEVDRLAVEISDFYYRETQRYKDAFGSPFNTAFMGISNYVPTGKIVGALPCGRKAQAPLTEGVSPFVGSDVHSPLSAMRSAAKINHDVHSGGTLLNLRLNQELVNTERGLRNVAAMIRAFFSLGAFHVQFNTVSNEVLRAAQENPEDYRDLLVRVAGYSTQFIHLSPEMQEAIIARNSHMLM